MLIFIILVAVDVQIHLMASCNPAPHEASCSINSQLEVAQSMGKNLSVSL